jgi:drug/metabolite transporter (DMT)-like permease
VKGSGWQRATAGPAAAERRTAVAAPLGGALIALAAWLLADEALAPREWLGGAIIVAASLFTARRAGTSPA